MSESLAAPGAARAPEGERGCRCVSEGQRERERERVTVCVCVYDMRAE